MDTKLKSSLTFLTFILLVSFFVTLAPKLSDARPLFSPSHGNEGVIGEVNGHFRTLKGAGPSPGVGHRIIGGMKDSGPSSGGIGHRFIGGMKNSGPSSGGVGHKYITNNNNHS
ncbi:uncharacterized protein LOC131643340 [Vicia villosa]|uniref:uncharacterized protein LOC131643340 n=1 Tax=Vicia villosa TaxID=3911 RepID=UPI00273B2DD1|nr:uncharacterized protein LOC131643340 [Vicia villosa]